MKITIGIPTNRGVKAKTTLSLLEMRSKDDFHFVVVKLLREFKAEY